MNGKKARAIRKSLEINGIDVREVSYTKTMGKTLYNPDGSVFTRLFNLKRTDGCGRSIYQQAKQNVLSAV